MVSLNEQFVYKSHGSSCEMCQRPSAGLLVRAGSNVLQNLGYPFNFSKVLFNFKSDFGGSCPMLAL